MSQALISRSPDLKRLRDEGYEVEIRNNFLVIDHVPYVRAEGTVDYGTMACALTLAGDVTTRPGDHTVAFAGQTPHDHQGRSLDIIAGGPQLLADGLQVDHIFSSKPSAGYENYYDKITAYIRILGGYAQAIDPEATAQTFRVIEDADEDSPFVYLDTASSRAGIEAVNAKIRVDKLAIVGLGGTGSYILDLLSKTPVGEIHLFDGDVLLQHNAFRAPGAPLIDELRLAPNKAAFWRDRYSPIKHGITAHEEYVDASNVEALKGMNFVFLALDDGPARKLIVEHLQDWDIGFIDVGMGVFKANETLGGQVRTTTSTPEKRDHVWDKNRIPFGAPMPDNLYDYNIQVADLNMLNAALAVIRWKKLCGYYSDLEHEHWSVYMIDGNTLINEDRTP